MGPRRRPSCWYCLAGSCCSNERTTQRSLVFHPCYRRMWPRWGTGGWRNPGRTERGRTARPQMDEPRPFSVPPEAAGQRLDQFLTSQLEGVSRSRVQLLMEQGDVLVDGARPKASYKLRGGESIRITGEPHPAPLKAVAEDIPLSVVFEDKDLAVIDKPAGMMVHAGSGSTDDARSRGTLVNALLHRFRSLSGTGGELRPGIVHRLDKHTSGLIMVAKNDRTHAALARM